MPKVKDVPAELKPYLFHGLDLSTPGPDGNLIADCPWCGRSGKFSVSPDTGLWQCFVCREGAAKGGGNVYTFLRLLHERSKESTAPAALAELAKDRGLLQPETLAEWEVCRSVLTDDWLVPGYGADGKLNQLYRYVYDRTSRKRKLLPTPGLGHQLHGVNLYVPQKGTVHLYEGPWDALAAWEILRQAKRLTDGSVTVTGNPAVSLLADVNVLAVPGCGSVGSPMEKWLSLLAGKKVYLHFDSDHPREENGRTVEPAGFSATRRATEIMARAEEPPAEVHYLSWGPDGYDPDRPGGTDVRDLLKEAGGVVDRAEVLANLNYVPVPVEWVPGRTKSKGAGGVEVDCLKCESWDRLVTAWRKPLKWNDGLDRALSVMLACITSTKAVGDQLWCKIIGPAACGKSTLCEALSINKKYVLAKSTVRGFHSGYRETAREDEDNSLLALVKNKTLVTKDGDTLLQAPNLSQILSEARDVYDRVSRTHYRNKASKDYEGVSMTWLLCGTSSLRSIDSSELGERFLDCVIVEDIDEDLEREVALRIAYRADREMSHVSDGKMETRDGPEMVEAKRLTGGYVTYLRENAQSLLDRVKADEAALLRCVGLGTFVAYMRARPSTRQEEKAEREMSYRLTSQMVRLAKCLAVVLNRTSLDEEVMRRTKRVALDTARGRSLVIAGHLYAAGAEGLSSSQISLLTGQPAAGEATLLRFLKRIGGLEIYNPANKVGVVNRPRWRLSRRLRELYQEVVEDGNAPNNNG